MIWRLVELFSSWRDRRRAFGELRRIASIEAATTSLDEGNPLNRAKVSLQAGDQDAARHYLQIARARIPEYVESNHDTLEVMLGLGDYDELDAFALARAKRSPRDPRYLEAYAASAEHRRDFAEAARRWAMVRRKFPNRRLGYVNGIGTLRQARRLDEAEALLQRGMRMLADDIGMAFEYGRMAEARDDWTEAHRRWSLVRERHPAGFIGAAQALQRLGRSKEAEALLAEGRSRYPVETGIYSLLADIAERAGDTPEAMRRWATFRNRFPLDARGYIEGLRLARMQQAWTNAEEIAREAIDRFRKESWPRTEYANLAHLRQDWPTASERWAAAVAAFPDRADLREREAEARAALARVYAAPEISSSARSHPEL